VPGTFTTMPSEEVEVTSTRAVSVSTGVMVVAA